MRQGWGGRPVRVEQAQGILVAAMGVPAGYYGYGRAFAHRSKPPVYSQVDPA